jgi:WD40 repeat protein
VSGAVLSPDGSKDAVTGPDGNWAVWPLDGSGLHPVPGLDSKYAVVGWSPDSNSIYAASVQGRERILTVYRVNPTTGKMEPWKKFGEVLPSGATAYGALFSADGSAYAYSYVQILSAAYMVKGFK